MSDPLYSRRDFTKTAAFALGASFAPNLQPARGEELLSDIAHFNNAGASLMPQPVLDAVLSHLRLEAEIGGYEAADANADAITRTYNSLARLLGCTRNEIALAENATRAWELAFYSLRLQPGDRILTSAHEYGSNYISYLQMAKRKGAVVEVVPSDEHGQISVDSLRKALERGRVAVVGLTHIPATGGTVNPVESVGRLTREFNVPFLLDAAQSIGQWPVDVNALGCDMLCGTGRKWLRGARGTGFLYVRDTMIEKLEPPVLDGKAAQLDGRTHFKIEPTARRFETWEYNVAGIVGLGVAVEYALTRGIDTIRSRIVTSADRLRVQLAEIPGVTVHDVGVNKSGIVTFTVQGKEAVTVRDGLRERRINVSTIGRRSTPLEFEDRKLTTVVRAGVHYFNTDQQMERLVENVQRIASQ